VRIKRSSRLRALCEVIPWRFDSLPDTEREGIRSSVAQHRPTMSYAQVGGGFDDADDALVADSEHRCSLSFAQVRGGLVCGL